MDINDLDAYVAMRDVYSGGRNAIAPPIQGGKQGNIEILRVRPHRWIVLEEHIGEFNDGGVDRVLVDLSNGRMVKHCISLFNDNVFVGSSNRLLILVEERMNRTLSNYGSRSQAI